MLGKDEVEKAAKSLVVFKKISMKSYRERMVVACYGFGYINIAEV